MRSSSGISRHRTPDRRFLRTGPFVGGYLLVGVGYSAGDALAQGALRAAALLSMVGASTNLYVAKGLLAVAGIYQWMPGKTVCLSCCRPL